MKNESKHKGTKARRREAMSHEQFPLSLLMTHRSLLLSSCLRACVPLYLLLPLLLSSCGAQAVVIVPTAQPTPTVTPTPAPTRTPDRAATATLTPTLPGGATTTPLFGAPIVATGIVPTARALNPNAARIEFFTTDVLSIAPGQPVNLYWSTLGTSDAAIYRIEGGLRAQVWNVAPDGSLSVPTRRSDRGALDFVLSAGEGDQRVEQSLSVPLSCPDIWFFQPPPQACPAGAPQETTVSEQPFERGRLAYIGVSNTLVALFNDGSAPAWESFPNRYDPAVHPEFEPSFQPPPGFYQPVRALGFLWRGNDRTRNRLGLATQPQSDFSGFTQSSVNADDALTLYITSADGSVLELLPEGELWRIIAPN